MTWLDLAGEDALGSLVDKGLGHVARLAHIRPREDFHCDKGVAKQQEASGGAPERRQRQIISAPEKIGTFMSELQQPLGEKHFDPAIGPIAQKLFRLGAAQAIEHLATFPIIDRAAVIGIDQTEIP